MLLYCGVYFLSYGYLAQPHPIEYAFAETTVIPPSIPNKKVLAIGGAALPGGDVAAGMDTTPRPPPPKISTIVPD